MTEKIRLNGVCVRNDAFIRIRAILFAKEDDNSWRAEIEPAERLEVGDRLRFGDASESTACFLAFLDAEITEKNGDEILLCFHLTGSFLDDALHRLEEPAP